MTSPNDHRAVRHDQHQPSEVMDMFYEAYPLKHREVWVHGLPGHNRLYACGDGHIHCAIDPTDTPVLSAALVMTCGYAVALSLDGSPTPGEVVRLYHVERKMIDLIEVLERMTADLYAKVFKALWRDDLIMRWQHDPTPLVDQLVTPPPGKPSFHIFDAKVPLDPNVQENIQGQSLLRAALGYKIATGPGRVNTDEVEN